MRASAGRLLWAAARPVICSNWDVAGRHPFRQSGNHTPNRGGKKDEIWAGGASSAAQSSLALAPSMKLREKAWTCSDECSRQSLIQKSWAGGDCHYVGFRPITLLARPPKVKRVATDSQASSDSHILGVSIGPLTSQRHTGFGPSLHCKEEEIAETDWFPFAKHIVMFIDMEDELRGRKRPYAKSAYPVLERFVVMNDDSVSGLASPPEQSIKLAPQDCRRIESNPGLCPECRSWSPYGMLLLRPAPLFSLPPRAEWAVAAHGKIFAFFVRAAHVSVAHAHLFDAVLLEEPLDFLLDLRVRHHIGRHPPLDDRLGTLLLDDARHDLRGGLVVRAVVGDGADGELGWLCCSSSSS